MKIKIAVTILVGLLIYSCENNGIFKKYDVGKGVEIYRTLTPYSHNLYFDYSKLDFDTIVLADSPILRYNDLILYDTSTHKITLGVSHDSLKIGDAGVYGRMFVVTVDQNPIYCGFTWPVISSIPCNWVFIEEPFKELDNLDDNEIVISFQSREYEDPRLDNQIVNRLIADTKIK